MRRGTVRKMNPGSRAYAFTRATRCADACHAPRRAVRANQRSPICCCEVNVPAQTFFPSTRILRFQPLFSLPTNLYFHSNIRALFLKLGRRCPLPLEDEFGETHLEAGILLSGFTPPPQRYPGTFLRSGAHTRDRWNAKTVPSRTPPRRSGGTGRNPHPHRGG